MELKINLTSSEVKDLEGYCKLNNLNAEDIAKKSYLEGFKIEKYGLLSGNSGVVEKEVIKEVVKYVEVPKEVEKEVIKIEYVEIEKPVEKIVEKEVIKEVVKEVPVEIVKEVPVEVVKEVPVDRIVEKIIEITKEVPVEKVVVQEVVKEVAVDKIVYVTDNQELNEKIFQKDQEFESERKKFSIKIEEMGNTFQKEKSELNLKIQELENLPPKVVEVIKEVPIEKIVEITKEVPVEKIVEKEVIREVKVENEVDGSLKAKLDALQTTVQKLKQDNIDKEKKIKEYEKTISDIQTFQQDKKAVYLRNSNLDDTLYR